MIIIDRLETYGWEAAMRGMRNPMNSWDKNDTTEWEESFHIDWKGYDDEFDYYPYREYVLNVGENDLDLAIRLIKAGTEHRKFLRQIFVSVDITAPLYWWKEFDTYKVGTTSNSCSTMHKLCARQLDIFDFSTDNMEEQYIEDVIPMLNSLVDMSLKEKEKGIHNGKHWRTLIGLLPSSYMQMRTVTMNYEVALTMIRQRKNHKLKEWKDFTSVLLRDLPYMKEFYEESLK